MPAGYSGTPLPKKLGIKEGQRVGLIAPPDGMAATIGRLPDDARLVPFRTGAAHAIVMLFARTRKALDETLPRAVDSMSGATALWICWPKKTSALARDLTGDVVRAAGLGTGIVDIKVCAIDEDWSGLKFVVRVENRETKRKK